MFKKMLAAFALLGLLAAACGDSDDAGSGDLSVDEINVAYFQEWPTPNQFGQNDGTFSDAVGASINWIPFTSGGAMSEAMIAGDIDIAYSQGLTPFAGAINAGADLKLVGIAVSYAEADNCIVQSSLGVTRDNAAETLAGATVMTPFGNVTHYKMLSMMEFLGVDLGSSEHRRSRRRRHHGSCLRGWRHCSRLCVRRLGRQHARQRWSAHHERRRARVRHRNLHLRHRVDPHELLRVTTRTPLLRS